MEVGPGGKKVWTAQNPSMSVIEILQQLRTSFTVGLGKE